MFTANLAVTITTIVANTFAAATDFSRPKWVLANMSEVHVAQPWLPLLGALKAAGAVGLVIGLLGVRPLGTAAASGLVLFFTGALVTHVRARVFYNIHFPGTYFALAAASLVLAMAQ